jgi:3-deoxy-manno-octulosonate cytidylyltransferase (CMP-KDO synthetase)
VTAVHIIIPARFQSTRLPGKPLADVGGKLLLQRVHERARASGARSVTIATDDERIRAAAEGFGAEVCMTAATHPSGTDRIAEAIEKLGLPPDEVVVNLQGDEWGMPAGLIRRVAETLEQHPDAVMATACHPIADIAVFTDPNAARVVCDRRGYALYFSRAPIPSPPMRAAELASAPRVAYRHIGLYAYRAGFVGRYCAWGPCPLEEVEQLEQLRVLWHGERIAVCITDEAPPKSIDTPEDLERARRHYRTNKDD